MGAQDSLGSALRSVFGNAGCAGAIPARATICKPRCFHCGRGDGWLDPVEGLEGEVECHNVAICERRISKALVRASVSV
jgi:hypothetical protein